MAERGALLEQTKECEERRKAEAAAALARRQEQLAAETFCCNGAHWLHMARISFVLFVALWLASMLMLGARVDAKQPALMLAAAASKAFEAQPPPLGTTLAVLGSTGGVLADWWLVLVPSERRDLAKNKNKVSACLCVHAVVIPCVALFLSTASYAAEHTGRS